MTGTEHLEVARADVAAMLAKASDSGNAEQAERYRAMLERLDGTIDRKTRKGAE